MASRDVTYSVVYEVYATHAPSFIEKMSREWDRTGKVDGVLIDNEQAAERAIKAMEPTELLIGGHQTRADVARILAQRLQADGAMGTVIRYRISERDNILGTRRMIERGSISINGKELPSVIDRG